MCAMLFTAASNYVIQPIRFSIGAGMPRQDFEIAQVVTSLAPIALVPFLSFGSSGRSSSRAKRHSPTTTTTTTQIRRGTVYVFRWVVFVYAFLLCNFSRPSSTISGNPFQRCVIFLFYVISSLHPIFLVAMLFNVIAEYEATATRRYRDENGARVKKKKPTRLQSFVTALTCGSIAGSAWVVAFGAGGYDLHTSQVANVIASASCLALAQGAVSLVVDSNNAAATATDRRAIESKHRQRGEENKRRRCDSALRYVLSSSSLRTIAFFNFCYGLTTALIDIDRTRAVAGRLSRETTTNYAMWNLWTSVVIWSMQILFSGQKTNPTVALTMMPLLTIGGYGSDMIRTKTYVANLLTRADILVALWSTRRVTKYAFVKQFREIAFVSAVDDERRRATKLAVDIAIPRIASFFATCVSAGSRLFLLDDTATDTIIVLCSVAWVFNATKMVALVVKTAN